MKDRRWLQDVTPVTYLEGGLFLGSVENAKDPERLIERYHITHAVHICPDTHPDTLSEACGIQVLRIELLDKQSSDLRTAIEQALPFIDAALAESSAGSHPPSVDANTGTGAERGDCDLAPCGSYAQADHAASLLLDGPIDGPCATRGKDGCGGGDGDAARLGVDATGMLATLATRDGEYGESAGPESTVATRDGEYGEGAGPENTALLQGRRRAMSEPTRTMTETGRQPGGSQQPLLESVSSGGLRSGRLSDELAARRDKNNVLVFCRVGQSRSVAVCLAYLMLSPNRRMSLREAFDFVRERRPMIYPNEGFRQQLLDMDPSLTTPEAKADLDRYIMVRCIQGLGLFFPQVASELDADFVDQMMQKAENADEPGAQLLDSTEARARAFIIRALIPRRNTVSSTYMNSRDPIYED